MRIEFTSIISEGERDNYVCKFMKQNCLLFVSRKVQFSVYFYNWVFSKCQ